MIQPHDSYAALRAPNFQRYFAGNGIFFFGMQMQKAAVDWEIYERTGSAMNLGYAGLASFLPALLLSLVAGHVTDRYNRKRVLIAAVALTGLASFGLAWTSMTRGPLAMTYLFLAVTGVARMFWFPARASFLPRIVAREVFPNAVSWNSTSFELAAMLGPAAGGLLIAALRRPQLVYALNGLGALLFLALVGSIAYRHEPAEPQPLTADTVLGGFRYIWNTPSVLAVMTLDMFGVLLGGATTLMPIYAKDILKVGPWGFGVLRAAPALGAACMAMFQAHRRPFARAGRTILLAVSGFAAATIVFGLSKSFWLSLAMLVLLGACDNISVVIRSTLIQMLTPDAMRGRVSSVNGLFIVTSNDLGGFESGLVAASCGPVVSVVSGGIGTGLVVALVAWRWPQLRKYGEAGKT